VIFSGDGRIARCRKLVDLFLKARSFLVKRSDLVGDSLEMFAVDTEWFDGLYSSKGTEGARRRGFSD
jgi:hypothetical protein